MTLTLTIAIAFATLMFVVAVLNRKNCRHLLRELENDRAMLKDAEAENMRLKVEILQMSQRGGISENSVLALAGEISRMDNNLFHMEDVPGRKQVKKALDRMKVTLQAEDYTIIPLLGTPYREGMQISAVFVPDESLPLGSTVITSVQKPQINRAGKMIQAASVTVGQNF